MADRTAGTPPDNRAGGTDTKHTLTDILRACVIGAVMAGALTACDSGDGGDNGGVGGTDGRTDGAVDPGSPAGLVFSYPVNGQTDVYPGTTIAFAFNAEAEGNVALIDTQTNRRLETTVVNQGNGIYNIIPADSDARMAPGTTYAVVAEGDIGDDDNTAFASGETLFAFTTEASPGAATDSDFTLVNFPSGNDAGFPVMGESFPFAEFNTLRARFSQPVDESSVRLCTGNESLGDDGCSVAVTGPGGDNVAGRLTVLGKNFVFDPGTLNPDPSNQDPDQYADDDLDAGVRYTVNFGGDFRSAAGQNLTGTDSFSVTPLGIDTGNQNDVVQRLRIGPVGSGNGNDSMTSPLSGRAPNNIELASQLIGSYNLAAVPAEQGGLQVRLAAFNGQRFGGKIPTVLPRGQTFLLTDFDLALGSQLNDNGTFTDGQIDTPINLDNLEIQFANDSDVYLLGNDLRNIESPTRVAQRLDLNIFGQVSPGSPIEALSNGVVNQTALNVLASGIAIPQDNGDISLVLYGAFPVSVNRDGEAAANFELELTLAASADDQPQIFADQTAPRITAQYPSACTYLFGTVARTGPDNDADNGSLSGDAMLRPLFESGDVVGGVSGTTTLSEIESNCINLMSQRYIPLTDEQETRNALSFGDPPQDVPGANPDAPYAFPNPWANNLPLSASPSILFSEAVDPESLEGNITLMDGTGNTVPVTLRTEGASVILNPTKRLAPNTQYTVMVGSGVTDLAGNGVANTSFPGGMLNMATFTTEPMVVPRDDDGSLVDISEDLDQRSAVRQTAPFLTALTPGLPCAIDTNSNSDYRSGGNELGNCIGDDPAQPGDVSPILVEGGQNFGPLVPAPYAQYAGQELTATKINYPVFAQPANYPVTGYFSKPVRSDSIKLANDCLIGGSAGTVSDATVAIQVMNGSSCEGVVQGALTALDPVGGLTSGFQFTPTKPFAQNRRYWIVICGSTDGRNTSSAASECSSGATIIGQNGLRLNTTPLLGTGTRIIGNNSSLGMSTPVCAGDLGNRSSESPLRGNVDCFDDNRGQGGPDIVMPFDGAAASANYATTTRTRPLADTNGNGFFDNTPPTNQFGASPITVFSGYNTGQDRGQTLRVFNDSLGREYLQPANQVLTDTLGAIASVQRDQAITYKEALSLGGDRPVVIEPATTQCSAVNSVTFDDGTSVLGSGSPSSCIPVELLPGGLTTITSATAAYNGQTGRLIVRFPYQIDDTGESTGQPQRGYIVPSCSGTLNGKAYDYAPCFVADLRVNIGSGDGRIDIRQDDPQAVQVPQQDIGLRVFGPVSFEQNGRLVIATRNANQFAIGAVLSIAGGVTVPSVVLAGEQSLQLAGAPIHGGLAFP